MRSVNIQDFDPRCLARGTKEAIRLEITHSPAGQSVHQTALLMVGTEDGPVLLLLAGLHGDEYEGPLAIINLYKELRTDQLRGSVVAVPVANVLAFETATRETDIDGVNLNRAFPGDPKGSVSRQIAYWMGERLVKRADFCIDFHSGGISDLPTLCAYKQGESPATELRRKVAEAFHLSVILAAEEHLSTQVEGYADEHDIPLVYTECPSLKGINMQAVAEYQRGARNTMRVMGILDGELEGEPSPHRLYVGADPDCELKASVGGLFTAKSKVLDKVKTGDLLGVTYDLAGNVLEEFRAPVDGCVLMQRLVATIHAGDEAVFQIVREEKTR